MFRTTYTYNEVYRGLMFLLPMTLAIVLLMVWPQTLLVELWFLLGVFLPALAPTGHHKRAQTQYFLQFMVTAMLSTLMMILLAQHVTTPFIYAALTIVIFLILCLPIVWPLLNNSAPILCLYAVTAVSYPVPTVHTVWQDIVYISPLLLGSMITACTHLLLPKLQFVTLGYKVTPYFFIRRLRIALAVGLVLTLGHYCHLQRPWWAALAVLVVSQLSLGATIRKASFRLLGTLLGVMIAIPIALVLFDHYPGSRFFVLALFTIAFIIIKRHEVIAIMLFTTGLGAIYYVLYPNQHDVIAFFIERIFETGLGVIVILTIETLFFPRSVIDIMRSHTRHFWQCLVDGLTQPPSLSQQAIAKETHDILNQLQNNLAELRYDPVALMSRRLHYVHQGVNQLEHLRKLYLNYLNQKRISPKQQHKLKRFLQVIAQQTRLPRKQRLHQLPKIKHSIEQYMTTINDETTQVLLQHVIKCLDTSLYMLSTKRLQRR